MELKEIVKLIETNPIAIATSTKDGVPNVSAAAYVKVKDGQIIVTNNYMKRTVENIKANPKVSIVAWNSAMKGCKIEGIADYFEEGEWMNFIKSIPENHGENCKGAIVITPLDTKEIG